MVQKIFRFLFFVSPAIVVAAFAVEQAQVDFIRDIQPIFRESCYGCHGPTKQSNGLRLDVREAALAGGIFGMAILPGRGAESPLYRRLAGIGDVIQMPVEGNKLTLQQIGLIKTWIDQGASWPASLVVTPLETKNHWAYVKPRRPDPPHVESASWVRNSIDNFILARLEKEGLRFSPEAAKETLIRRVTLDLTGLPATLEEIDAFLSDRSADAYEKVVDRLLASARYGERWARPWLDLARYADTNGYEKDNRRSIWLYRDWVINALNQDMPFDRFTLEQIGGELFAKFQTSFYSDPTDAVFKAFGVQ